MNNFLVLILSYAFSFAVGAIYFGVEDDDENTVEVTSPQNFPQVNKIITKLSFPGNTDLFFDADAHKVNEKNYKNFGGILLSKAREPGGQSEEGKMLESAVEFYLKGQAEILWIPQLLWDLYMIDQALIIGKDNLSRQRISDIAKKFLFWFFRLGGRKTMKTRDVYHDFHKIIATLMRKIIASTKSNERDFGPRKKKFTFKGLDLSLNSDQNPSETSFRASADQDLSTLVSYLKRDYEDFLNHTSILNKVLSFQIYARNNNVALLYRVTNPTQLSSEHGSTLTLVESPFGTQNIENDLKRLSQDLQTNEIQTKPIDYRYSIFSGCLERLESCPYYRFKSAFIEDQMMYALALKKEWLLTKGRHIFYLPSSDLKQEIIRPRINPPPLIKYLDVKGGNAHGGGFQYGDFTGGTTYDERYSGIGSSFGSVDKLQIAIKQYEPENKFKNLLNRRNGSLNKGLSVLFKITSLFSTNAHLIGINNRMAKKRYDKAIKYNQKKLISIIQNIVREKQHNIRRKDFDRPSTGIKDYLNNNRYR